MERSLYRIVSLDALLNILLFKRERFVSPFSWQDTFEGCSLRYATDSGRVQELVDVLYRQYLNNNCIDNVLCNFAKVDNVSRYTFGQCWSTEVDSDAMWRIYSYGNKAIQIESSAKMIKRCFKTDTDGEKYKIEIRPIKYDVVSDDVSDVFERFYQPKMNFNNQFLHKRKAFKHEKEHRVLVRPEKGYYRYRETLKQLLHRRCRIWKSDMDEKELLERTIKEYVELRNQKDRTLGKPDTSKNGILMPIKDVSKYIKVIRVHPQAEEYYVKMVEKLCDKNGINFGGQSQLYTKI